jgi:hypothetical protein
MRRKGEGWGGEGEERVDGGEKELTKGKHEGEED